MKNKIISCALLSLVVLGFTLYLSAAFSTDPSEAFAGGNEVALAPRTEDERETIDVYKRTRQAVVFITTITLTVDPNDIFLEVQPKEGTGSGIIVDAEQGVILTNLHVIRDAHKIQISLADGQNFRARLVGYDEESDLAVLQIQAPPKNLVAIPFGDSAQLEVGQRVLAIGNPFGLNHTLTAGIISSLDRSVQNPKGSTLRGLIQTDASINPGNSGGPLLDMSGRLIGINSAILSQSGDSAGIGFAVPSNQIKRVLPELIATGKVLRPKLGWILVDTTQGPMIRRTLPDGPADRAGAQPLERRVKEGFVQGYIRDYERADLIYKVNGQQVRSKDQVEELISRSGSKEIICTVRRGGIDGPERELKITPLLQ